MQLDPTQRLFYPTDLPNATETDPKSCLVSQENQQEKELEKEGSDKKSKNISDLSLSFIDLIKKQNKGLRSRTSIIPEDTLGEQNFRMARRPKDLIMSVAERCPKKEVVLILGAGDCSNLPLAQLTKLFKKVILVDLDDDSMKHAKNQLSKELQEKVTVKIQDLSGVEKFLAKLKNCVELGEFKEFLNAFLDTPTFASPDLAGEHADLVISSEVLNNLGSSLKNYISHLNETYFGAFSDFLKILFSSQPWERFVLELTKFHLKQLDSCLKVNSIAYITFCDSIEKFTNGYYSTKQIEYLVPKPIVGEIEQNYRSNQALARKKWKKGISNPESKLEVIFQSTRNATTIFSPKEKMFPTRSASEPLMRRRGSKLEGIMEGEIKEKFSTPTRSKREAAKLQSLKNLKEQTTETSESLESSDSTKKASSIELGESFNRENEVNSCHESSDYGVKVPPIKFEGRLKAEKERAYDSSDSSDSEEEEEGEEIIYSPRQDINEERGFIRQPKNTKNMQALAWSKTAPSQSSRGSRLRSTSIVNRSQQKPNPHSEE